MKKIFPVLIFLLISFVLKADLISDEVYREKTEIDSTFYNQLHFKFSSLAFFKDNEYVGNYTKGYTLPGFRINPVFTYYPAKNLKIEAGAYLLSYWGTQQYPISNYKTIPDWDSAHYSRGFHALPFFRFHWAALPNFNVIIGDIYGGANHDLVEPLYFRELNLTADPEAGAQLLFDSRVFDGDLWINWESFIFNGSPHQEVFTVGFSSKFKLLNPDSHFELSIPLQWLAHHRGGELDTLVGNSVNTLMNAATGLRFAYYPKVSLVKRIQFEALGFLFYQQAGTMFSFNKGWAFYPSFSIDLWDVQARVSYWKCNDFVSILGSPFYNSITYNGEVLNGSQNINASLQYCKKITKSVALGADFSLYYTPSTTGKSINTGNIFNSSSATSFSFGVCARINPDFLLYSFKKRN